MAMTNEEKIAEADSLFTVIAVLKRTKGKLDTRTEPCTCCSMQRQINRSEYKADEQLAGAIGRIEKVIELLGLSLDGEVSRG